MTTIATLAVKLIADAAGFIGAMDQAEKKTQTWSTNVSKKLKEVGGNITSLGQQATGYLTLPLVAAGIAAVNYASDLEETKSKVNVVFGDMSEDILSWSKNSATAMGQSQNQALSAASTYGNLFITLGMGKKPAADMSMSLVQLASDLASFNNANPEEVLTALQSGLIGQSEPMRKFGVNLSEAAVALKAVEMGLVETNVDMVKANGLLLDLEKAQKEYNIAVAWYGEESYQARSASQTMAEIQQRLDETMAGSTENMSEAAKVQARYALIMEQTTTAQGDFIRTADGLANQQRILKAQFVDSATALGYQLLPYALQFVNLLRNLVDRFQALTPEQQKWVIGFLAIVAVAGPLLVVLGSLITAVGAIVGVIGAITTPILIVIAVIAALIAIGVLLYQAWTNNWLGIQQVVDWVLTYIRTIVAAWQAAFSGDWYQFGQLLRQAWDMVWNLIANAASNAGSTIKNALSTAMTNAIAALKNFNWADAGKNIVLGIRAGILGNVSFAISAVQSMGQAVMDAIKGFFGIASPAKLLQKEVAPWLVKGAFDWTPFVNRSLFQPAFARVPGITAGLMRESTSKNNSGITLMNYGTVMMPEGSNMSDSLLRQLG